MRYDALSGGAGLLGGVALALAVALLFARRARTAIAACAAQSWAVALALAWPGLSHGDPGPVAAALVVIAAQGGLVPFVLRRADQRRGRPEAAAAGPGALAALPGIAALLAVLVLRPNAGAASLPAREHLTVAVAVALGGLLAVIARRDPLVQATGVTSLLSGALLALAPLPLVLATSALATAVALGAAGQALAGPAGEGAG